MRELYNKKGPTQDPNSSFFPIGRGRNGATEKGYYMVLHDKGSTRPTVLMCSSTLEDHPIGSGEFSSWARSALNPQTLNQKKTLNPKSLNPKP